MQAPVETRNYPPVESQATTSGATRYRWITALFALLASLSGLLAHAIVPALLIAWWQDTQPSTDLGVVTAWALFIGSFLVAAALVVVCAFFVARTAAERTGRRGSGLGAATIVATCAAIVLALGGGAAILLQASPLTAVNSPPFGVAALSYHSGLAEGLTLFYCAAYLPLLLLASATGLLGAMRGARLALRARAGAPTTALTPAARRVA